MPYCPTCRAEYRIGFTTCAECDVPLVETLDHARPEMTELSMAAYLEGKELILVAQAPLERLKPLKELLTSSGIPNMIIKSGGCCTSGGCSPSLDLIAAVEDADKARAVMQEEFRDLVALSADDDDALEQAEHVVRLDAENMTCPACNASLPAGTQTCSSCGLYIGIPDEA